MSNILSLAIYMTTFVISAVSVYFASRSQNKAISFVLLLSAIFLPAGIAALRTSGTDYSTYEIIFNYSKKFPFDYPAEFGWLFLNFASPNFEMLLFIAALIFLAFGLGGCMRVLHKDIWLAWLAFLLIFLSHLFERYAADDRRGNRVLWFLRSFEKASRFLFCVHSARCIFS